MDKKAYEFLRNLYAESLGKPYDRDVKNLFEVAKEKIAGTIIKKYQKVNHAELKVFTVSGPVTTPTRNSVLLGVDRDQWTLDITSEDRKNYDSTLEKVLAQLEPVCLQEQQFCVSFFQVSISLIFY